MTRALLFIFSLAVALPIAIVGHAQESAAETVHFHGNVIDKATGAPLEGARVLLWATK